jgi:transcriptional regulator with XRE-family HTH domain
VTTRAQKIAKLKNKEYRDAFIGSQISIGLPFQIRALREQKGWKQSDLAKNTGMLQPRISAIEAPGGAKFTIETLRRLASAFDVALIVRFVPFSELVDWSERFNPDEFKVSDFASDAGLIERKEPETAIGHVFIRVPSFGNSHLSAGGAFLKMPGVFGPAGNSVIDISMPTKNSDAIDERYYAEPKRA